MNSLGLIGFIGIVLNVFTLTAILTNNLWLAFGMVGLASSALLLVGAMFFDLLKVLEEKNDKV